MALDEFVMSRRAGFAGLVALACVPFAQAAELLDEIYAKAAGQPLAERIEIVSAAFLGQPYVLDPAGEGPDSLIDRDPIVRLDAFDCQTYVETVLAVVRARAAQDIESELLAIRYRDSEVAFGSRLHFPEVDWIPVNSERGVLRDITADVAGAVALAEARTAITRAAWLRALPNNPTQARHAYLQTSSAARAELERLASQASTLQARTRFIPKANLSDSALLERIPHASVVMIVRPMTSMFGKVGSRQNISHMGFAIRTPKGLVYRHASSTRRKAVVDRPMTEYLEAMAQTRTFGGIVVFQVVERSK